MGTGVIWRELVSSRILRLGGLILLGVVVLELDPVALSGLGHSSLDV